ncbi:MAG: biopolymer transporter ExbD [Hymenobacteraceae bacterium]|nr:biopolymer transporter ExbD [Hymenobacteraceae bacterium]
MNLSRRRKLNSHVETGAMNVIMFFLMLFFLIASTMVNPNVIKLLLPNAKSGKQVMKRSLNLSLTAEGEAYLDQRRVPNDALAAELGRLIPTDSAGKAGTTIILRVDRALNVQKLVDVLDIGNQLKVRMVMAADAPK